VKRDGSIDDAVLYEAYVESPQEKLSDALKERNRGQTTFLNRGQTTFRR
jgi:hypothetical protein